MGRPATYGFFPKEKRILDLWDEGLPIGRIVRATGYPRKYVQETISRNDGAAEFRSHKAEMAEGSAALLQAMRAA